MAVRRRADVHRRAAGHARAAHRRRPAGRGADRRGQRGAGDRAGRCRPRPIRRPAPGSTSRSRRRPSRSPMSPARRDRWRRWPASRRCCCSGRRRTPPAAPPSTRWRADAARWMRAGVAALAIAMPAGPDARGAGAGRRRRRAGDRRAARSRDGLRAGQPAPLHEPAGHAAADGVPRRRRRPHRQGLSAVARCRRASPPTPAPSRPRTPEARLLARRAVPGHVPLCRCRRATSSPYGRELMDQGLEAAAVVAFERAAQATPNASTLYRLGTLLAKSGEPARARAAYERALALQPDLAEALNDLGALQAQSGDLEGAVARFRAALAATPDYPDALNNLGYALLRDGPRATRPGASLRAGHRAAARLPRSAQQHGPAARARRRPGRGRALLPATPWPSGTPTGRRPTTWPWSWSTGARPRPRPGSSRRSW